MQWNISQQTAIAATFSNKLLDNLKYSTQYNCIGFYVFVFVLLHN